MQAVLNLLRGWGGLTPLWCLSTPKFSLTSKNIVKNSQKCIADLPQIEYWMQENILPNHKHLKIIFAKIFYKHLCKYVILVRLLLSMHINIMFQQNNLLYPCVKVLRCANAALLTWQLTCYFFFIYFLFLWISRISISLWLMQKVIIFVATLLVRIIGGTVLCRGKKGAYTMCWFDKQFPLKLFEHVLLCLHGNLRMLIPSVSQNMQPTCRSIFHICWDRTRSDRMEVRQWSSSRKDTSLLHPHEWCRSCRDIINLSHFYARELEMVQMSGSWNPARTKKWNKKEATIHVQLPSPPPGASFQLFLGGPKFFYFPMPPDYWKIGKNST